MIPRFLPILALLPLLHSVTTGQTGQIPCLPPTAQGVICLQGTITGVLQNGTVYHVFPGSGVPAGMGLQIQGGAIVKFTGGVNGFLAVEGTLTVGLTAILTSIHDDTAGGDSNGNGGQTVPAPGDWGGLVFGAGSDASSLIDARIRYAATGIRLNQADISITLTSVRSCSGSGLDLTNSSYPVVSGCAFNNNNAAVPACPLGRCPTSRTTRPRATRSST